MRLSRRTFLRFLASGVAGTVASAELDIDRLLWVPGAKTIFLPSNPTLTMGQIVALEWERVIPRIAEIFERDDTFYSMLTNQKPLKVSFGEVSVPLIIKPGDK